MPAEIFTKKLREALKTKSEDNLLAFVCNYIHGLKMAVQSGEQRLDGIGTYNEYWGISEKTSICSTKKVRYFLYLKKSITDKAFLGFFKPSTKNEGFNGS